MDLPAGGHFRGFQNHSDMMDEHLDDASDVMPYWARKFGQVCLFAIPLMGICGNLYSILYFTKTGRLKRTAALKFLTALAIADLVYLISFVCKAILVFVLQIVHDFSCKLNAYLIYLR